MIISGRRRRGRRGHRGGPQPATRPHAPSRRAQSGAALVADFPRSRCGGRGGAIAAPGSRCWSPSSCTWAPWPCCSTSPPSPGSFPRRCCQCNCMRDEPPPEAAPAPKALAERSSNGVQPSRAILSAAGRESSGSRARGHRREAADAIQMDSVEQRGCPHPGTPQHGGGGASLRGGHADSRFARPRSTSPRWLGARRARTGPGSRRRSVPPWARARSKAATTGNHGGAFAGADRRQRLLGRVRHHHRPRRRWLSGGGTSSRGRHADRRRLPGRQWRGSGTGVEDSSPTERRACFETPRGQRVLDGRSAIAPSSAGYFPPGLSPDQGVTLNFRIDAAGSATRVAVVRASDNALGASAVDALRTAAPFPPMNAVRCAASPSTRSARPLQTPRAAEKPRAHSPLACARRRQPGARVMPTHWWVHLPTL